MKPLTRLLFSMSLAFPFVTYAQTSTVVSETINVTPGMLKEALVDLETRPQQLILTGSLNSADLAYICEGQGKIASVTMLDLSAVDFEYDDGMYASVSGSDGTGIGLGTITRKFYLSEVCHADTTSSATGLGGSNSYIDIYSNDLAGLFLNNTTLQEVALPQCLNSIGIFIFNSSAIQNVTLPENLTAIPEYAFAGTEGLTTLELPSTVTTIEEGAFKSSYIRQLTATGLRKIGDGAFYNSKIETIDLSSVEELGTSSFWYAKNLASVDISSLTEVPERCFYSSGISSVTFGNALTRIGRESFYGCENMTSAKLPDSVTHIDYGAFLSSNIQTFNIPDNVEYIGGLALSMPWLYNQPTDNGVWYFGSVAYKYDSNATGIETIEIKEGTKSISSLFSSSNLQGTLRKLVLPSTLERIGDCTETESQYRYNHCFENCSVLEEVNFPSSLKIIGDGAFKGCTNLVVASWPASLEAIGSYAFSGCKSLYTLTLPENLTAIGSSTFDGCEGLSSVKLYSKNLSALSSVFSYNNAYIEKVTVGPAVEYIPDWMFGNCAGLIKVVFEDGDAIAPPLEIGDYAFVNCPALKISSLPERAVKVGEYAFERVQFGPDFSTGNIRSIGCRAFYNASGITNLTITNSLEECGGGAFSDIEPLATIYYNAPCMAIHEDSYYNSPFARGSNFHGTNLKSVTIGQDVEYIPARLFNYQPSVETVAFEPREAVSRSASTSLLIDEYAFNNCGIRKLELPDVRTAIGSYAFADCSSLVDIRLGNGTENIDANAFRYCQLVTTVDMPSTVVAVGENAFYYVSSLYFHTIEPPTMNGQVVNTSATVYVPAAGETGYMQTSLGSNTIKTYSVSSFVIDKGTLSIDEGDTATIVATVMPTEFAGLDLIWTSSDESVATVDNSGIVAGISPGNATITAKIAYIDGFSATCDVTVNSIAGIEDIVSDESYDPDGLLDVYNLQGVKVSGSLDGLAPGIYILRHADGTVSKRYVRP